MNIIDNREPSKPRVKFDSLKPGQVAHVEGIGMVMKIQEINRYDPYDDASSQFNAIELYSGVLHWVSNESNIEVVVATLSISEPESDKDCC
jgi:hypothetical protein